MSNRKRKAIITGGSKGIGKAIAERFAQENIDIYLLASNEENLVKTTSELQNKYKVNINFHASNLKTKEGCNSAIKIIEKEFHDFDTLIFSAGATKSGDFLKQPIEDFEDGFALKFYSAVRLSKAFWPTLSKNRGWVVSINGAMSHSPDPFFMVGGAVNAAFLNFSKALSKRGLVDGVNVNSINPGMTSTDRLITIIKSNADREGISFAEAEKKALENIGLDRFGTPEEVAELTYFLCNPKMRHLTGTEINLDGGKKITI
jgi:3-oxoacyl-[acyl-carrier protein] reductase